MAFCRWTGRLPFQDLRCHEWKCPCRLPHDLVHHAVRQAQIEQQRVVVATQQDVLGFDVTVDDSAPVQEIDR